jgi:hypothetical protein
MGPEVELDERQLNAQLFELRELMVLCLAWVDVLFLKDVAPHLDRAVSRLDAFFAERANLVSSPDTLH